MCDCDESRIERRADIAQKSTHCCECAPHFEERRSSTKEHPRIAFLRLSFQMCCSLIVHTAISAFIAIVIPISLSLSEFTSFVLLALRTFAFCICFVYKRSPRTIIKFFCFSTIAPLNHNIILTNHMYKTKMNQTLLK